MKVVRPTTVTDSVLDSSSVSETLDEYNASTVYSTGDEVRDDTTHKVYESLTGAAPVEVTITNANPGVVTQTGHGLAADTPVAFSTTDTLPTGLTAGTVYYVRNPAADTYEVSATAGGGSIDTTGSQSGTHSVVSNPNKGNALTDASNWLDLGPTNRWAMFDVLNGTRTTATDEISVTLLPGGRINSITLANLLAVASAHIEAKNLDAWTPQDLFDTEDGSFIDCSSLTADVFPTLYEKTASLVSNESITDWYSYFYTERTFKQNYFTDDLPAIAGLKFVVTLTGDGTIGVGELVIGQTKDFGEVVYGAEVGIIDYSRKVVDEFGIYSITQRSFADKATWRVAINPNVVDDMRRTLANYRATPTVYVGSGLYSSLLIFGFYREFGITLEETNLAYCNIELEGLT